tara:strand:- start:10 stop:414 length:405 start_codon:yes stop_codon:yes gene_type:complete
MATQVQFRRGTTNEHSIFKGADGEVTVDTTIKTVVVHDAITNGGFPLLRQDGTNSQFERGSTSNCALKFSGDANTGLISPAADELAFVTGGSIQLRIDSSGASTFTGNVQVNGSLTVNGNFDSGENLALIIALG